MYPQGAETPAVPGDAPSPSGCSWPWEGVQQGRRLIAPHPLALLKTAVVCGRGPCPCPCPQPGWARVAKFLRADADVVFSATPLGSRAGCLSGLAEGQPSPQLSSRPPVPAMALSGTRSQEGHGGCWSWGWEPVGAGPRSSAVVRGSVPGTGSVWQLPAMPLPDPLSRTQPSRRAGWD